MLVFALLAVVAFIVDANTVQIAMENHDYECGDIVGRGKCGEYLAMEAALGGDAPNRCPGICVIETHGCSELYFENPMEPPVENPCDNLTPIPVKLAFDNTCVPFAPLFQHIYINLMQNFICGSEAACLLASGQGSILNVDGCDKGIDYNGLGDDEAGTHDVGDCNKLPNRPFYVRQAECWSNAEHMQMMQQAMPAMQKMQQAMAVMQAMKQAAAQQAAEQAAQQEDDTGRRKL